MIHQLRYHFEDRPSVRLLREAHANWLAGKPTPGVVITPLTWPRKTTDVKRAAVTGHLGTPGIVKMYARPDVTMCDFDTARPPALESVWRLAKMLDVFPLFVRYDRTRRGWHLIIQWNRRFKPIEIVAIQAVLGSDRARELFNLARVFSGKARNRRWNLLFERKLI